jgi:hypothetical protein
MSKKIYMGEIKRETPRFLRVKTGSFDDIISLDAVTGVSPGILDERKFPNFCIVYLESGTYIELAISYENFNKMLERGLGYGGIVTIEDNKLPPDL